MNIVTESLESYKHKAAKQVLASWLRNAASSAGFDNYAVFCGLGWRVNRSGKDWGVFEEYPITCSNCNLKHGFLYAWDETKWLGIPSYDELIKDRDPPLAILDVAVQEKGRIVYGFEVIHTHRVTPEKAMYLNALQIQVFELDAEWILRQVRRPDQLAIASRYGKFVNHS